MAISGPWESSNRSVSLSSVVSFLFLHALLWKLKEPTLLSLVGTTQGILINGQFPGPQIEAVTNDNLIINVFNSLPEPFLLSWSLLLPHQS